MSILVLSTWTIYVIANFLANALRNYILSWIYKVLG
jgi:hypothetical protein